MSSPSPGGLPDSGGFNINPCMYRRPQRPGFQPQNCLGKRTLADFQFQNQNPLLHRHIQQQRHQGIEALISTRSVKPRIYQIPSLIPAVDCSNPTAVIGLCGMPKLPQQQSNMGFGVGSVVPTPTGLSNNLIHRGVPEDMEAEKKQKVMMNRLLELEKQLLDDEVEEATGDSVSALTENEWSDTIRNLIPTTSPPPPPPPTQQQKVNTSSPASSSSSCSSAVASPLPICHKKVIMEAAAAIADGKSESAAEIIKRLALSSNQRGTPEQRLAYYMSSALKSKLQGQNSNEILSQEHYESVRLLYKHSSCFKLGFLAANLEIIEATADVKSLHVVDFDMGDGAQLQNLLQLLSLRKSGKPTSLRITAVDVTENCLVDEGRWRTAKEKLSQLSERIGVPLQLKTLRLKINDLSRESLRSSQDEVVAVNLAYSLSKLPDESVSTENQRDELLRRVKGLKARVVTVVEKDMNCNTAPFQTRVAECCSFYGALLESMDSGTGRDDAEPIRVEEGLGRMMVNSVACEGEERVERCEVFGKWRARMGMAGFEMKPVSQSMVESLSSRINNSVGGSGARVGCPLFVRELNGGVCFGWMGRILTVTSAWR